MQGPRLTHINGFTLIEVMVSVVIVTMLGAALASLTSSFVKAQAQMATADVAAEFTSSFGRHLMTQEGCESALNGKELPAAGTEAKSLSIAGYETYGAIDETKKSSLIQENTELDNGLRLSSVTLQEKSGVKSQLMTATAPALFNHVAVVKIGLERSQNVTSQDKFYFRPATFELPVVTDSPTGGHILGCRIRWQPEAACNAIDWTWDAVKQQCQPGQSRKCVYEGTYVQKHVHVYFWIYSHTVRAFYLQGVRLATPAEATPTGTELNTYTGGGSCPAGTTDFVTGGYLNRLLQVIKHPNGKGEAHLYLFDQYHSCMRCS
ncbi:MAG: prepilin-type N-terminal cleavage/methylation domain-containing protein [Proteobacteria bacterium]|nr:MAG: prepilin-type N-terminal cleavage/methylation domain-containing protein [Pseudomonadota bacterium]